MESWGLTSGGGDIAKLPGDFNITPFLGIPASQPPEGIRANLKDPQRDIAAPIVLGAVLLFLMLVFLGCRMYSKCVIVRRPYWDDVACIIGAIAALLTYGAAVYTMTAGSMGYHSYDLTVAQATTNANFTGAFTFFVGSWIAAVFIKLAFLIMYWVLFNQLLWMRIAVLSIGTFSTVATSVSYGLMTFYYVPHPGQTWLEHILEIMANGKIVYLNVVPNSAISLISDILILILPMPALWGLHLPRKRRIGLMVLFLAGIFACLASALNLWYRVHLYGTSDLTHDTLLVYIVTVVEQSVGVTCASAPAAFHVFRYWGLVREARSKASSDPRSTETFQQCPSTRDRTQLDTIAWAESSANRDGRKSLVRESLCVSEKNWLG